MKTDVNDFIGELGAGVVAEQLGTLLSSCSLGTVHHGVGAKKGKITLELTISQMGENEQVVVSHKLLHKTPTKRGTQSEDMTAETMFYVGRGGQLTINPPKEDNNGQYSLASEADGVTQLRKQ